MSWQIHKLVYQAKSPIHIGYHKLGFIQRTRYYITGKAMWGAMTANITRAFYGESGAKAEDYEKVGKKLCGEIIPSYFYPAIKQGEAQYDPLLPRFGKQGLKYGKYSAEEFERRFIHSFGQTAIEAANLTAEDNTLHETEYIASVIEKDGEQKPVYFVGYIFAKTPTVKFDEVNGAEEKSWDDIKEIISEIFVGGERRYGFGRLRLDPSLMIYPAEDFFGYKVDTNIASFNIPYGEPIHGHLPVKENLILKGDIEPLVGREWGTGKDGEVVFGQKVSNAKICWMPGSIIEEGKSLKIGDYGIFEQEDKNRMVS